MDIDGLYNDLEDTHEEIRLQASILSKRLSKADREVSDILHYLEFSKGLTLLEWVRLGKLLRTTLKARREVKEANSKIMSMLNVVHASEDALEYTAKKMQSSKKQKKYKVKELNDIFGDIL